MNRLKITKWTLVCGWALGVVLLIGGTSFSRSTASTEKPPPPPQGKVAQSSDYVGEDTCVQCHADQSEHYAKTAHADLKNEPSWEGKVVGCESCHGPGKAHVEAGGDKSLIRNLGKESPKQISDTCLECHAGREEHNNFRRGEHWRNDVGCTDCHSSHEAPGQGRPNLPGSNVYVERANAEKPGFGTTKLLKSSEPQLCMSCHTETNHQFKMPFHHKVLEGAMRCSDCHNPHGGFETKQSRLATGADAACIKCHADKQGPFTYEHAPVKTEGCAACHAPHGSSNPRLLKTARVAQLCLECHTVDHGVGAQEPAGPSHNLNAQYADCTACHVKVHGSHTSPVFMR